MYEVVRDLQGLFRILRVRRRLRPFKTRAQAEDWIKQAEARETRYRLDKIAQHKTRPG